MTSSNEPELRATLDDGTVATARIGEVIDRIEEFDFRHNETHIIVRPKAGHVIWNGHQLGITPGKLVYFRRTRQEFAVADGEPVGTPVVEYHVGLPNRVFIVPK